MESNKPSDVEIDQKFPFIKEFSPKSGFVYCYFVEKKFQSRINSIQNILDIKSEEKDNLYGINFASDIQQFYYYRGTKDIYTFIGFTNQNQLEAAIYQPTLRKAALNCEFFIFPLRNLPSSLTPPKPEQVINNEVPKKLIVHPTKNVEISLFLFIETFQPIDDIFYCYFEEKDIPTDFVSSFHLNNRSLSYQTVFDVQRFVYHPHEQKIFTFFGFLTKNEMENAIQTQTLLLSAKNKEIFIYKQQENHENDTNSIDNKNNVNENNLNKNNNNKNSSKQNRTKMLIENKIQNSIKSSNFQNFIPKENLVYFYVIEKTFQFQNSVANVKAINSLINCIDIQRYCFFPNSKVVCSFYGFSNYKDLKSNFCRFSKYVRPKIYSYFLLSNKITVDDLKITKIHKFVPKKGLIYFYFHENSSIC